MSQVNRARARVTAGALLALAIFWVGPGGTAPLAAQRVSLEVVDSLIAVGQMDEARDILVRWTDAVGGNAPRLDLQRAMWQRALLTVAPDQAALELRRLTVEFPGGAWTAPALLRLARYSEEIGRTRDAVGYYRTLVRDHPGTPERPLAANWLEENADLVRRVDASPPEAPAPPPDVAGPDSVVTPTTTGKNAGFVITPDSTAVPPVTDSTVTDSVAPDPVAAAPDTLGREALLEPDEAPAGDYTVQLGAFEELARARAVLEAAREAGFEARLVTVPGSDLVRVRSGRFENPELATELYDRIVASGLDAYVVPGADSEEPVG